ncbi:hypothetical protein Trydic_g5474 [Trypoxylus dichotomus]
MTNQIYRESVLHLIQEKDRIEDEIRHLTAILTKNGVGMTDSLVDSEGFPLNHIDIYQIRHARHEIICLQNDHRNIMKQIENGLGEYYNTSKHESVDSITKKSVSCTKASQSHRDPFAKVTIVTEGSPAAYAGLKVGDLIVEFGSINVLECQVGKSSHADKGCRLNNINPCSAHRCIGMLSGQRIHTRIRDGGFMKTSNGQLNQSKSRR